MKVYGIDMIKLFRVTIKILTLPIALPFSILIILARMVDMLFAWLYKDSDDLAFSKEAFKEDLQNTKKWFTTL